MSVTTTETKNRFSHVCAQATPVVAEKGNQPDSIIAAYSDHLTPTTAVHARTLTERREAFNEAHKDWLAEQNRDFEQNGLWCDGSVVW